MNKIGSFRVIAGIIILHTYIDRYRRYESETKKGIHVLISYSERQLYPDLTVCSHIYISFDRPSDSTQSIFGYLFACVKIKIEIQYQILYR